MASKDYRRQFLFELSLSAAQANFPVHSRGRCIIGFNQGVQPNFSEKCGNVGMAMKMWEFFFKCGNY